MNVILDTPLPLRYALLAAVGAVVGGLANWGIYRFAHRQRSISPHSAPPPGAPPRRWRDRLPIVGWYFLRREAVHHGAGFWIRPLLIELACTAAYPALYWWVINGNQLPPGTAAAPAGMLHGLYLSHAVLLALMIMATFIDFDEKLIPDFITVPGTLFALTLALAWPAANLPVRGAPGQIEPLLLTSPNHWNGSWFDGVMSLVPQAPQRPPSPEPSWLDGTGGLRLACACYVLWLLALVRYTLTTRHGWKKAFAYFYVSILRYRAQVVLIPAAAVIGLTAIVGVWSLGGAPWQGLLSALVGMAGGGGLVWMVRIAASYALGREAMGFGDVTLMAMVGAFLGWQPAVMIFFMAPALGCLIAVVQFLTTGEPELAFGPYLCAATAVLAVFWDPIWNRWGERTFEMGWYVPAVLVLCVVLMGIMLIVWRWIKQALLT